MITPLATASGSGQPGATTIYRATFANGQQAHVIPIGQAAGNSSAMAMAGGGTMKNFRPITPSASHIYMEIDPVYNTSETLSDILVSDLSDDDLRRSSANGNGCSSTTTSSSSDDSRGTGGRYHDGRHYQLGGGQHHHLSMRGDNNSISGLLCEQQQQHHRPTNNSIDYNNSNNILPQSATAPQHGLSVKLGDVQH
jgi:hypothetical protein